MPGICFRRGGWGAALLLLFGSIDAPTFADDRMATRVELFGVLGLHVLTLRTVLDEAAERYTLTMDYATTGVAGLFVDQSSHSQAVGRLTPLSAQPAVFQNETRRNGIEIRKRVDYRPDGTVDGNSTPPLQVPVTPAAARGTVDNLTAYFRLQRQVALKKTCALTVPVFDGRYRYDLVFADAGLEKLSRENGQEFEGTAIGCRMTRHLRDTPDSEEVEGAQQGVIWYASLLPGDVVVPVRMKLDTQIGSVDGFLAELHGRGVDLVLMK
jgi:hypothetical protein